jgi:hypothetical protein
MGNSLTRTQGTFFIAGLCGAIILGLLPFISLSIKEGKIPTIVPEVVDDSLYYYARTSEVVRGKPLIGNPYYFEHRDEIAPSFFITDWFGAVPRALGLPMNWTIFVDIALWVGIFYSLGFFLFKRFGYEVSKASLISFLVSLSVLWLVVRPVSMQIVFPFFLLYLLALYDWLADLSSRGRQIFIVGASGLIFYLYSYAAQLVIIIFALLLLCELYKRRWERVKQIFLTGMMTFLVSLPSLYFLYRQIKDRAFWETMVRTGLIRTHSIGGEGFLCLSIFVLGIILIKLSFTEEPLKRKFFSILGLALALLSVSNVVTGKDLETAVHAIRFMDLWFVIVFFCSLPYLYRKLFSKMGIRMWKKVTFCAVLLICLGRLFMVYGVTAHYLVSTTQLKSDDSLTPLLTFIEKNLPPDAVILASDYVSGYIPIYTKDYVLFHPAAGLQLVTDSEVFERYAISRAGKVTTSALINDMRLYRGVGPSEHAWKNENRSIFYCNLVGKVTSAVCPQEVDRETYYGNNYFSDLEKQDTIKVEPYVSELLSKYHVEYVILDNTNSQFVLPKNLLKTPLYEDGRFKVYALGK